VDVLRTLLNDISFLGCTLLSTFSLVPSVRYDGNAVPLRNNLYHDKHFDEQITLPVLGPDA
jgi:hypothetical protein